MIYRIYPFLRRSSGQARLVVSLIQSPLVRRSFSPFKWPGKYLGITSRGAFLRLGDRLWIAYSPVQGAGQ